MLNTIHGNAYKAISCSFSSPQLQLKSNRNVIERKWLKTEGLGGEKLSELMPHPVTTQSINLMISYMITESLRLDSHLENVPTELPSCSLKCQCQHGNYSASIHSQVGKIFLNLPSRNAQQQESPSPAISHRFPAVTRSVWNNLHLTPSVNV